MMRRGFDVGSMRREGDTFLLTIGYHQLDGQLVALKKPLVILEKRTGELDMADDDSNSGTGVEYKVRCAHASLHL